MRAYIVVSATLRFSESDSPRAPATTDVVQMTDCITNLLNPDTILQYGDNYLVMELPPVSHELQLTPFEEHSL